MRITFAFSALFLCAGLLGPGVLQARAQAASVENTIAVELEKLAPQIRKNSDQKFRGQTLQVMATALARLGKQEAALRIADTIPADDYSADWKAATRDEVWRITARRLAWQGNIAAATRSANRIKAEYSRADALLAISRAQLRLGNSDAARRALQQAERAIEHTKSPRALSYLAFLFARTGDAKAARACFAQAKAIKSPDDKKPPFFSDDDTRIIAWYRAKAGWIKEAWASAGTDVYTIKPIQAILVLQRDWQSLHDFATKMPPAQATNFLIELAITQMKEANNQKAARASYALAQSRFAELSASERESEKLFPLQIILAVMQAATGDEAGGRARFAELSHSPHFNAEWEAIFYFFLATAWENLGLRTPLGEQRQDEQKAIAAFIKAKTKNSVDRVDLFVSLARAQARHGDKAAMRQTLQIARAEIRTDLMTPRGEIAEARRSRAANNLLKIAKFEREVGETFSAGSTLAQTVTMMESAAQADDETASLLLRAGFADEAAAIFEKLAVQPVRYFPANASPGWIHDGALPVEAMRHARQLGAFNALRWVLKIKRPATRAMALAGVAFVLTRSSDEEREFTLSGDKKSGAHIAAQIHIPGYSSSVGLTALMDNT